MNEALIEQKSQELLAKIRAAKPNITVMGTTYYVSNEGDAVLFRSGDTL